MGELHDEIVRAFWDGVGGVRGGDLHVELVRAHAQTATLEAELEVAYAEIDKLRLVLAKAYGEVLDEEWVAATSTLELAAVGPQRMNDE